MVIFLINEKEFFKNTPATNKNKSESVRKISGKIFCNSIILFNSSRQFNIIRHITRNLVNT